MMKTIAKNTINSVNSASSFEVMCFSYFDYKFIRTQSKAMSVLFFFGNTIGHFFALKYNQTQKETKT